MPSADRRNPTGSPRDARRWLDGWLVASVAAAAAVLGCQELFDGDVWWHLRAGQWILAHRRLPSLDPFTFASADRYWVDVHWAFQVILALAFRLGGVGGMLLLSSVTCGVTLLIALTSWGRDWPGWIGAAVWIPAVLLMSLRFSPRPEVFSLLFTATYLALLCRCDRRPALAWGLPLVQILWVNSHGLFVLGPIVLAAYIADGGFRMLRGHGADEPPDGCAGGRWWRHIGLASIAVLAACLVNPYGLRGALFPLELLPKIFARGGPYKAYIGEFNDPRTFIRNETVSVATRRVFGQEEYFLFLLLATSFLVPAIWATWVAAAPRGGAARPSLAGLWLGGMAVAAGLATLATLGLPLAGTPSWLIALGQSVPAGFLVLGLSAAAALARRAPRAALLAACGGVAVAGGIPWLRATLLGIESSAAGSSNITAFLRSWMAGLAAALAVFLTLRAGGRLFRILLTAIVGYLALQAIRNGNIFGLVAGFVVTANLGEWTARVMAGRTERRGWVLSGLAARAVLATLVSAGTVALAIGPSVAGKFGLNRIGLREKPLTFAHDAARFAGRSGMPRRALVFDLTQAAVYLYHNAPGRKPFMDPRLEVPSLATFETYVRLEKWLNQGRPGWADVVDRMGGPLILLDHEKESGAEGTLLADSRWRCVYFDAVAAVFLPKQRADLEASYPTIDFAARHFLAGPDGRAARGVDEAFGEARGLVNMGFAMLRRRETTWTHRIPLMLLAGTRAREALDASPGESRTWFVLGASLWNQAQDLSLRRAGPADAWDAARSLTDAQATYALRRAVDLDPNALGGLHSLRQVFELRGMSDARDSVTSFAREGALPSWSHTSELSALVEDLLRRGRPQAAVALAHEAEARRVALPWDLADRTAITHLHLGEPAPARRLWEHAKDPPSPALRLARIAEADLVALDFEASDTMFRAALERDRYLGEAWFGLALLHLQRGKAAEAFAAGREGLTCPLTEPQRTALEGMEALVARFLQP